VPLRQSIKIGNLESNLHYMIRKLSVLPGLFTKPLRATSNDLATLNVPEEVRKALKKTVPTSMPACAPVLDVDSLLAMPAPTSSQMFHDMEGNRYPCWLEGDENLGDDWLLADNYYPFYHRLYNFLGKNIEAPRLLEFGVRSGYSGLVFAKALQGKRVFYTGVDPNLYIPGGLEKAASTFRLLKEEGHLLDYFLLEGFSSSSAIQNSLKLSGPFHIIHVDGEHTYFGKLYDLWIARNLMAKGGYVLVDDFEHHGMISDSVKVALEMGWFTKFSYVPTKRGMAVLS
jgi:hypothetical protein